MDGAKPLAERDYRHSVSCARTFVLPAGIGDAVDVPLFSLGAIFSRVDGCQFATPTLRSPDVAGDAPAIVGCLWSADRPRSE